MEPKFAIRVRRRLPLTPLKADAWERFLRDSDLTERYPTLLPGLRDGFHIGIRPILVTHCPPNSTSLSQHPTVLASHLENELALGRWIGPFEHDELEAEIGPYHTSPLSAVPRPGDPDRLRLIQNFSAPRDPRGSISSINSSIEASDFPCTWGTAAVIALLVWTLPPGSQFSICDVEDAFRTVPLHPSQWPGTVVRISETLRVVDPNGSFGTVSLPGTYGLIADAGCDIFRWTGIGPISKWVDDHWFTRILLAYLKEFNERRAASRTRILARSGGVPRQKRCRIWWEGGDLPDGSREEFAESMEFPVQDLSGRSPRSDDDARFSCCDADLDAVSNELGIVWKAKKTQPWASVNPFLGFIWDVESKSVAVSDEKRVRYLGHVNEWFARSAHSLLDSQRLHGRLQHLCFVLPEGRAYLFCLQKFMGVFAAGHNARKRLTPPKRTREELDWWRTHLRRPIISRSLPRPVEIVDVCAFSDASSGVGLAVVIGEKWRAWRLLPGWRDDGRDIGWAEAVAMEFLVLYVFGTAPVGSHIKLWGDNNGVVEGWWKGRSGNEFVNDVFKRLYTFLATREGTLHTRYIESASNPADKPSRGIYGPRAALLPRFAIPAHLRRFLADFDDPPSAAELSARRAAPSTILPKHISPTDRAARAELNSGFQRDGDLLWNDPSYWWDDFEGL